MRILPCLLLPLLLALAAQAADISSLARERKGDLAISSYIVSDHVKELAHDEKKREDSVAIFNSVGVTQIMIEAYRGGIEINQEDLAALRDFYTGKGFSVLGGIATVAGKDFGVPSTDGLYWFNYQAKKTQEDLERVCRTSAKVFDAVIIDDFLCTGDESEESTAAKGDRDWGAYRRELITTIARDVIIGPMKQENPNVKVIVKYPQWYDRFHLFGYDTESLPQLFDAVWVGTESRGRDTQRFGFTQPYEGYVNYRWLSSIGGEKTIGAWFDHADCDAEDFADQLWTTVMAGAQDIVLFEYSVLRDKHEGHDILRRDFGQLADLAAAVAKGAPDGVGAYKPANSDPGGDMYIMDFIGMFGVPLVPLARFPEDYASIFLPTQAAHDPEVAAKAERYIAKGGNVVMTLGFLATAKDGAKLAELAGVRNVAVAPAQASAVAWSESDSSPCNPPLDLGGTLEPGSAKVILKAQTPAGNVPLVTMAESGNSRIFVLNVHTFSQADFDKVGEMLLSPRDIGLMHLDRTSADIIKYAFVSKLAQQISAPVGVTMFTTREDGVVVQNHNDTPAEVRLTFANAPHTARAEAKDAEGNYILADIEGQELEFRLKPRERLWVKKVK